MRFDEIIAADLPLPMLNASSSPSLALFPRLAAGSAVRWVLACWLLSVATAVVGPWASGRSLELVCSSTQGIQVLVKAADGEAVAVSGMGDCALCQPLASLPPPQAFAPAFVLAAHQHAAPAWGTAMADATAPPLPARGPPGIGACM